MGLSIRYRTNSPKVINEIIDGEAVIINLDTGHYYSLDKVGAGIWSYVENSASLEEIITGIIGQYHGNPTEIEQAVIRLINELRSEDLIVPVDSRLPDGKTTPSLATDGGSIHEISDEKSEFVPPVLQKYTDMQELLLLDPIHEVDEAGWPSRKPDPSA